MVCEKLVERAFKANDILKINKSAQQLNYADATKNEIEMMDISLFKHSANVSHKSASRDLEVGDIKVDIHNKYLK
jgi:hypothetical protein